MRRHLRPLSATLTFIALFGAVALSVILLLALRRDPITISREYTASDRVLRSPLLPEVGWRTYGGDVWSVGYPDDWSVKFVQDLGSPQQIVFIPSDEQLSQNDAYFTFSEESRTQQDVELAYAVAGTTKSEFLFAGYPALKFSSRTGREEYYLFYNDRVFRIVTDNPQEEAIGIMLATFQFLY